jgi:two-component system, cell cycle sensor histidine kinase and response regulator CckA
MIKILIVDDNPENIYLLQSLLKGNGYDIISATNGEEALETARNTPPDLIISDVLMPVMDGFTLCRQWKQDGALKAIPFVFYTATYTDPKDEELALSLGADLFIIKPAEPDELIRMIRDVIAKYKAGSLSGGSIEMPGETTYLKKYNAVLIRKLEDKLVQLEEANKALAIKDFAIASAMNGIVMVDLAGNISYVNDSFAGICGLDGSAIIGRDLNWLFKDENVVLDMQKAMNQSKNWLREVEGRKNNGTPYIVQISANTVVDWQGKPLCTVLFCVDVTENKKIQEELQRAQRLEALSIFAGGIAHDFNNFLTSLFCNIELAQMKLPADSPARSNLNTVLAVFERAKDLTQRLLSFSKGRVSAKKEIKITDIINECCSLSLSGTNIHFQLNADKDMWTVEGDANQLAQVFNNIIINARQAMAEGGTITISIRNRILAENQIAELPAGKYVEIAIKDEGAGIADAVLPKIFDPFYTTKEQGTGLGLATSYSIVNYYGGHISVVSEAGAGSTFTVWLPVPGKVSTVSRKSPDKADFKGSGLVLVMDDDQVVRNTTKQLLESAGYEVLTAANGKDALAIYQQAIAAGRKFAVAILDLTVRGGMGGAETIVHLRKIDPQAAVIVSSGYTNDRVFMKAQEYGFAAAIAKPYLPHELLSTVKAATANRQPKA